MLRSDFQLEKIIGIEYFITDTPGIGGVLRRRYEDFVVTEVPVEKAGWENGEYTYFTLEKMGWDTIKAVSALSKTLGVSKKRFGFAGTKDRRALTRQRMAVWNIDIEKLRSIKIKDMRLYDFKKSYERITLGDLLGNEFLITVRDPELGSEEVIEECKGQLSKRGIPNYFGYQRFGVVRPNTHVVGKMLLKDDIKGAVLSYLGDFYEEEQEDAKAARKELKESMDFKEALKTFPKRLGYERTMLDYLYKNPTDFAGALRKLHKKLRQMFVHGYQSYIFNHILSRMIENEIDIKEAEIPLFGYNSSFSKGPQGDMEREVLDEEGMTLPDFRVNSLPELSLKGAKRKARVETKIIHGPLEDGSHRFKFFLPKGSYATTIMRDFMKTEPMRY
ncbi:MAG: tRNA pseudouridine(13) synthase TruD [Candidatus Hydrothermarchaeales archaeon]